MSININEFPQIYNKVNINTEFINNNYNFDNEIPPLENITNVVRNDIKITPPLYPITLSSACIKNGYLYPKCLYSDPYPKCKKYDDFYYPAQQINKIDKKDNDKKDNDKKDNDKKDNDKKDIVKSSKNVYEFEPRFNNVIYPWRGYTWMYPLQPNTENYYIDNIKSTPVDPIIIPNLDLVTGTSNVKNPILEKFNIETQINLIEIIYIIIIIILIYFLIINRK
jgi:hypothetical protein